MLHHQSDILHFGNLNLFTSIEVSDVTPDKSSSEKLLEVKVLAWQRDREDVDKKSAQLIEASKIFL